MLFVYIFFYRFWEDLIGDHIVNKFLCHLESNSINNIIIVLAGLGCLVLMVIKWGKNIKQHNKILYFITIMFWIYYRWFSQRYNFTSFYLWEQAEKLRYIDIIPLYAFCRLLPALLRRKAKLTTPGNGFIRDIPIVDLEDDILDRKEYAKRAVNMLMQTSTDNGSFTYGIDSPWGAGKTSFMNMMKKHIHIEYPDCIIIDFNPWLYSVEKDLVSVFFNEISNSLKQYDPNLAKNMIDYSKMLSAFDTEETKLIASLIELTKNDFSLQEKKKQITNAIIHIKRKIVVFIDDLDRLDADELMEMMKLIRNITDFPYVYFVAAYDKSYLVKCLESRISTKGIDFSEKIFQMEFPMPPCSNETLRKKFLANINYLLLDSDKFILRKFIKNNDSQNPLSLLSTLREVNKLSNRFSSSYGQLKGHVFVSDLLVFELFKTKYPTIHLLFVQKRKEILVEGNGYLDIYQHSENDPAEDNHLDFIKFIKKHSKDLSITQIDLRSIECILHYLFPRKTHQERQISNRINDINCSYLYFNLNESNSNILGKEFQDVLKFDFEWIKKRMDSWIINKSYSLCHIIENYESDYLAEQIKLIHCICYLLYHGKYIDFITIDRIVSKYIYLENKEIEDRNHYNRDYANSGQASPIASDSTSQYIQLPWYKKIIYDPLLFMRILIRFLISPNIRESFIVENDNLVENNNKPEEYSDLTKSLTENGYSSEICKYVTHLYFNEQIDFPQKKEKLIKAQQELFNCCIMMNSNNISNILRCFCELLSVDYHGLGNTQIDQSDDYVKVLVESVKQLAESNISSFIPLLIQEDEEESGKYRLRFFTDYIWGSLDAFYDYFFELSNEPNSSIPEFKRFLTEYKINGYNNTSFSFNNIILN